MNIVERYNDIGIIPKQVYEFGETLLVVEADYLPTGTTEYILKYIPVVMHSIGFSTGYPHHIEFATDCRTGVIHFSRPLPVGGLIVMNYQKSER